MARNYQQGIFKPRYPEKYVGKVTNIISRSSWELRVMKWLDGNPAVLNWCSEEVIVPYYDPSSMKNRRYFPDFLVKVLTKTGEQVFMLEVKPEAQTRPPSMKKGRKQSTVLNEVLTWETNKAKWEAADAYCKKQGWVFKVVSERDLNI